MTNWWILLEMRIMWWNWTAGWRDGHDGAQKWIGEVNFTHGQTLYIPLHRLLHFHWSIPAPVPFVFPSFLWCQISHCSCSRNLLCSSNGSPKSVCAPLVLVMDKFGSELRFEPEPPRTEPEVQFRVLKNGWTEPQVWFRVRQLRPWFKPVQTASV